MHAMAQIRPRKAFIAIRDENRRLRAIEREAARAAGLRMVSDVSMLALPASLQGSLAAPPPSLYPSLPIALLDPATARLADIQPPLVPREVSHLLGCYGVCRMCADLIGCATGGRT